MDRIEVRGLRVFAHHGVQEAERRAGQIFVIDVTLELDLSEPAASDRLTDTLDYADLVRRAAEETARTRYDLIEALAEHLAQLGLADPRVQAAEVRVAKPEVRLDAQIDHVAVVRRIERA